LRGQDLNLRPSGYEHVQRTLPRLIVLEQQHLIAPRNTVNLAEHAGARRSLAQDLAQARRRCRRAPGAVRGRRATSKFRAWLGPF
jgi:hypothetical protein